jgi:hypothetical protein
MEWQARDFPAETIMIFDGETCLEDSRQAAQRKVAGAWPCRSGMLHPARISTRMKAGSARMGNHSARLAANNSAA